MARRACHTSFYCFQGLKEPTLALNSRPSNLHLLRAEMTGTGRHPQLCHAHTAQCPTLSKWLDHSTSGQPTVPPLECPALPRSMVREELLMGRGGGLSSLWL